MSFSTKDAILDYCKLNSIEISDDVAEKERGQRRLAEISFFAKTGVEPSLLLSGEFLVLLFRDKSTENALRRVRNSYSTTNSTQ